MRHTREIASSRGALASVFVDDTVKMVTVTLAKAYKPDPSLVHEWHEMAGNLGYGISFERS